MAGGERFAVATEQVSSAGDRLTSIAGELSGTAGWLAQTADAAADTAAADACAALARRWTGALAHMSDSADRLAAAVRAAADCYAQTDNSVMPEAPAS